MNDLDKLAKKYGTDKYGKHNYTPFYYNLFKDKRKKVEKVIEIGVAEGAGVRMFRDFFPNAMIYGAEIEEDRIIKEDRIEVFKCDQNDPSDLVRLLQETGTDIDLVVDDGSHVPEHQEFTARLLMLLLNPGVTYIIEDVSDENILTGFKDYKATMHKFSDRYDDRIIMLKHNE